jgi:dTDP-4-dehydrorhamnose reductase
MSAILITGASGQLGNCFRELENNYQNYKFIFADSKDLDLTNGNQISDFFKNHKIDYCINCGAYTAVDNAEENQEMAYLINSEAVKNLALDCQKQNAILIHYSTDYVFDGTNYKPYTEDDETNPINYYGETKLAGEKLAIENNPKTIILRTSWVYSSYGKNFVKTMLELAKTRDELKIINDQIGSPTLAGDLAQATLEILEFIQNNPNFENFGIYNYSGEGVCSWYDFCKAIMAINGNKTTKITAIETKDYPTKTTRPHFSVLNKTKIKQVFNLKIPYWRESLIKFLN